MIKNWQDLLHYHFIVLCGTRHPADPNQFLGSSNIEVIALNEEGALKKARQVLKRPDYQVTSVKECFNGCEPRSMSVHFNLSKELRSPKLDDWDEDNPEG